MAHPATSTHHRPRARARRVELPPDEPLTEELLNDDLPSDDLTPEEQAARIWPVYYDDLGYPIEFKKEPWVSHSHNHEIVRLCGLLEQHFQALGELTTIATEWPVIWDKLPRGSFPVSPDVMVIRGRELAPWKSTPEQRKIRDESYRVWEHTDYIPDFALELSSKTTWKNDISTEPKGKLTKYGSLGIREYVVADVRQRWMEPPLRMWRRLEGRLVELEPSADGRFYAETLGLELALGDGHLRLYRPDGTELVEASVLLTLERERAEKERERAEKERERAEKERERADGLARELEALRSRR